MSEDGDGDDDWSKLSMCADWGSGMSPWPRHDDGHQDELDEGARGSQDGRLPSSGDSTERDLEDGHCREQGWNDWRQDWRDREWGASGRIGTDWQQDWTEWHQDWSDGRPQSGNSTGNEHEAGHWKQQDWSRWQHDRSDWQQHWWDWQAEAKAATPPRKNHCANPNCNYRVHSDVKMGSYCCKKCYWIHMKHGQPKKNSKMKRHGEACERIFAEYDEEVEDPVVFPENSEDEGP